ncbi:ArnT family glycosyltransferase [Filimonas effusa]|uniref:Glycosyltransferase family 39 protein n=1 Tax=Filimonas effusa TaxID=2508721 RepID=A0A4Q1DA98_9BACT|nr:glycosyltransferase family 39 protein [Filimonas effusa]RXK86322.1 glycosyltransferase family 39 protein [Filimonas effusa]
MARKELYRRLDHWEHSLEQTTGSYLLLLLLAGLLFGSGLDSAPIYILDEAKNAQCAREMLQNHNYIVPFFNGELRTDKPVFHYWMMIIAYQLFGTTAFAARFFSAVAGILLISYTHRFTRMIYDRRTAFWTCILLLAALHLSLEMHFAVPDPYFIFFVTAAIYEYYLFENLGHRKHLLLAYLWVGFGVLSKGPAAILLPGGIVFFHLLLSQQLAWQKIRQLRPLAGLLIVAVIAAPWYILVHLQTNGLWTRGFFLEHNIHRFSTIMEGHGGFFLLTVVFVIVGLLPFAVWLLPALVNMLKKKLLRKHDMFMLIAGGFITLFFTISRTKLPNYTIPAYPFFTLLLARYWLQLEPKRHNENIQWIVYLVLMFLLPIGVYIAIVIEPAIRTHTPLAFLFLLLPMGAIAGRWLWKKQYTWSSRVAIAGSFMITILLFNLVAYPRIYRSNPVQKALHITGDRKEYVAFRSYNPGFNFYLPGPIPVLQDSVELKTWLDNHPQTYVITRKDELTVMGQQSLAIVSEDKDIFELPVTVVLAPAVKKQ